MSQGSFSQEVGGVDLVNLICLLGYARVPFVYTYSSQFVFCGGLTGYEKKKIYWVLQICIKNAQH